MDEYVKLIDSSSSNLEGKRLVISDGFMSKVIELDQSFDLGDKPIREAVFSAKITAYKA